MSAVGETGSAGRIDEAGLAYGRQFLGVTRPLRPWNTLVTADTVWHFAMGMGDDNPLWNDREYAARTSWGGLVAPPTYLYSCTTGGPPPGVKDSADTDDLLPGVTAMWANDHWQWFAPTREGMTLSATSELHAFDELPDTGRGPRVRQVDRHSFYGDGALLAICDKTIMRIEPTPFDPSVTTGPDPSYERPRYTDAERAAIAAHYDAEAGHRRGAEPRPGGSVAVGDTLGRLAKGPLTVTNLVGWFLGQGSFICQTHRMQRAYIVEHPGAELIDESMNVEDVIEAPHFNRDLAAQIGMPDGYDIGGQRISWFAHLLTDWCGDDGVLTDMTVKLLRPNFLGDITWVEGSVAGVTRGEAGWLVDCTMTGTNQRGEVNAAGTATVLLPAT